MWALLPGKAIPGGVTPSSVAAAQGLIRGPWLDQISGSNEAQDHPVNQQSGYGRDLSMDVSDVAAHLCLNYSQADLKTLASYLIQVGIDNYGLVLDGADWHADGGHGSGRKLPIVFAGVMLNDPTLKSCPWTYYDISHGTTHFRFGEDGQTYYYNDSTALPPYQGAPPGYSWDATDKPGDVACLGVKGWIGIVNGGSGDTVLWQLQDYYIGIESFAHEHLAPSLWSSDTDYQMKSDDYRTTCTSHVWIGEAMLCDLFGSNALINQWNHQAFFDYCARWMSESMAIAGLMIEAAFPGQNGWSWYAQGTNPAYIGHIWNAYLPSLTTTPGSPSAPTALRIHPG
jgi:hypothetical protein